MSLLIWAPLLASQLYMGRVMDAYSREPLSGVAIAASDGWVETSNDGSFYLVSGGEHFLIQKEGYWPSRVDGEQLLNGVALLPEIHLAPRRAMLLYSLNASGFSTPQPLKDGVMVQYQHPLDNWLIDARLEGGFFPEVQGPASPFGIGAGSLMHRWGRLPNQLELFVGPGLHVQFGDVVDKSSVETYLSNGYMRVSPGFEANFILRPLPPYGLQWRTRLGYFPFAFSLGTPTFSGNVQAIDGYTSIEWTFGRFVPTLGFGYHLLAGPLTQLRSIYRFGLGTSFLL